MEQLTLFEPNEARRQSRGKENISEGFQVQYEHRNGQLYQGNSIDWLASLDDSSVDLVFADPPTILKKQIGIISRAKKNILSGLLSGSN